LGWGASADVTDSIFRRHLLTTSPAQRFAKSGAIPSREPTTGTRIGCFFGWSITLRPGQIEIEDLAIQKENSRQRMLVSGECYMPAPWRDG
jgi:hypothetical protein